MSFLRIYLLATRPPSAALQALAGGKAKAKKFNNSKKNM